MTICQACNAHIDGPDRFCRSCGAPVPPLVGDLADTQRFDGAAQPSEAAQTASQDPTSPFYAGPRPAYPAGQNSAAYHTGSLAGKLLHSLLRIRPKILWPVMFLLISLSLTAGVT